MRRRKAPTLPFRSISSGRARCGAASPVARRRMPKGLYARALLIVIAPMVLLQSVVA
jgi:hypothetical protein